MRISWLDISERIKYELQQREEEGNDVSELRSEWSQIQNLNLTVEIFKINAEVFYSKIEKIPSQVLNGSNEPSEWRDIIVQCKIKSDLTPSFSTAFIEDRILGGWLGRSAGCMLGKPIEKIHRTDAIELLSSNNTWPISDYLTGKGISDSLLQKYPWNKHYGKESLRENIVCMPEDDDMNYPMLNLSVFEKYGEEFTTEDVIQTWMSMAPVLTTFTAERVAYVNRLAGIKPPQTATIRNPYREWIGAQIRADLWGWTSPGQPTRAAEFACRDAQLSHVRNGMYGEIFLESSIRRTAKSFSIFFKNFWF